MIRFEIDRIESTKDKFVVPGRVHEGTIRLGSIFTAIEVNLFCLKSIHLTVVKIIAYEHSLDELPVGMTGELTLTGSKFTAIGLTFPVTFVGNSA